MSLKLIRTFKSADGKQCAKVYRDTAWDEYVVKFYKLWPNAIETTYRVEQDYFTDDKDDALSIAQTFVGA